MITPIHYRRDRAIAITGGKGGVGKSTISLNLAVTYARQGSKTLALDADLGMADLNLLLGVAPEKSLYDVLQGTPVAEVLVPAHGIHLLPALNGSDSLENMDAQARHYLFEAIESLDQDFETLIIDVAAGIGHNQTAFAGAVPDTLVVVTPEPLSLADAYACLKVLSIRQGVQRAYVVPNRVRSSAEAQEVVGRLSGLVNRFLDMELISLPYVPYDPAVPAAAAAGVPMVIHNPDAPASRAIKHLARRLDSIAVPDARQGAVRLFWRRAFSAEGDEQ